MFFLLYVSFEKSFKVVMGARERGFPATANDWVELNVPTFSKLCAPRRCAVLPKRKINSLDES